MFISKLLVSVHFGVLALLYFVCFITVVKVKSAKLFYPSNIYIAYIDTTAAFIYTGVFYMHISDITEQKVQMCWLIIIFNF